MKLFVLAHSEARNRASQACQEAPDGYIVKIMEPTRNSEQNDAFHAILTDLEKSKLPFAGKPRNKEEWKLIMISGHAQATGRGCEAIPGIEGEFINLRESSAKMGKARMSSLIEYATAFAVDKGVKLRANV